MGTQHIIDLSGLNDGTVPVYFKCKFPFLLFQALFARDAFSKHIYAKLFDWIVRQLNKTLVSTEAQKKFIGVLDIYG